LEELLAHWTSTGRRGVSNGPTEATNALIKKVKRVGLELTRFGGTLILGGSA